MVFNECVLNAHAVYILIWKNPQILNEKFQEEATCFRPTTVICLKRIQHQRSLHYNHKRIGICMSQPLALATEFIGIISNETIFQYSLVHGHA